MADAVIANWDGHDYQARFFWIHASGLRNPETPHVVEVSYETDGPKGFDDVVVRYSPGQAGRRSFRVEIAHHQVKFHVTQAGRFGFRDLIEPEFIGATAFSILERLKEAVEKASPNSTFTLVTTDRVRDDDPLSKLLKTADKSLDVEKLAVGKTERSEMGEVRALWRKHLKLDTDEELYAILDTFHIMEGYHSLQDMREHVDLRFQVVGLTSGGNSLEFKFDGAARALKVTERNVLTREAFEALCIEQGWIKSTQPEDRKNISIRSFSDGPTDYLDATPDNTLSLLHMFDVRHLQAGADWNTDVRPAVEDFLTRVRETDKSIRLFLDSHASVAFLAGAMLGFKTNTHVELNQKGRGPTTVWRSDDGKVGPPASTSVINIGDGLDVAVVVSFSRNALADVQEYVTAKVPSIGRILHVTPEGGPGQKSLAGGEHASDLADQIADALKALRPAFGAQRHFFISGPNAFAFSMGQHRDAIGPVTLYEFDFKGAVDGSYHPSFRIG
ncbi:MULTISPECIES: SAVED domain-containing protein [Rhizobium]|uniref:SAVED domain-containing protein n=1 Tax=Rhizobium leguminosarum TaxID=384 RepID=A0ABD7PQ74_RHILE|nr:MULTISPECIES: SAVED domain-containing protein [Rhizobium]MBY5809644.1 SAVED domain-containing protein [Rhizobium leguminosarum]NEI65875.1 SAVED domain-containing protein [Rhizobium leguminosarum]TAW21268.1 SAVED domain-containing protein [Rhizobium ruizarguesonis]TAW29433.1 SAVED domain-containing protein [Rhizobium leguminosarum]TAW43161.1 SAVED domain-containing protein [Rhizobium leguminosarum]